MSFGSEITDAEELEALSKHAVHSRVVVTKAVVEQLNDDWHSFRLEHEQLIGFEILPVNEEKHGKR